MRTNHRRLYQSSDQYTTVAKVMAIRISWRLTVPRSQQDRMVKHWMVLSVGSKHTRTPDKE